MEVEGSSNMDITKISEEGQSEDGSLPEAASTTSYHEESTLLDLSTADSEACEIRAMSQNASRRVRMWRNVVTCILILIGAFLCVGSYLYLSRDDTSSFEDAVRNGVSTWEKY